MNHFYVITNWQKDPHLTISARIAEYLNTKNIRCTVQQLDRNEYAGRYKYTDPRQIPEDVDCVIVLGGDGTVLRAARDLVDRHIPIFGVNMGTLGYLAEVDEVHLEEALECLVMDEYMTQERMMLKGSVSKKNKVVLSDVALNDIVITRNGRLHVMQFHVYVNDRFLYAYSADGIIVSTPTGSTGYNLSAGGPIVDPSASMILLTPVAAHALTARSVILADDAKVKIVIERRNNGMEMAEATFDGDTSVIMKSGDTIEIEKAESTVTFVKIDQISFLEILRRKMAES